ncbi:MAG: threonine--tRNA ligase [Myxococcales bacterium]|nr:threonine--tRNA ligase [Myxococcales bacterium]MCB9754321.1 threonine--tRNA ligase [Myxococcales bacterium]
MSIAVTLPDGSSRSLEDGATVLDLARSISPGLAKATVIGLVNDRQVDVRHALQDGDAVRLVTDRDPLGLETLRHSAAHLMAAAILEEFPSAQLTIGPVTDDGFYYDIFMPDGQTITPADFPKIEQRMKALAKRDDPFVRCVAASERDPVFQDYQAIDKVEGGAGFNQFKREIVDELKRAGALSGEPDAPELSFYRSGGFIDLCRGPHVPSTGWLKHTKLMKVSGAYWRADASREPLVRVYGTAFFKKKELAEYLHMLEEAKKRDHRVLGEQLDLFHFVDDAPGFPFLHPKGATIYNLLQDFMRGMLARRDYHEVRTPLILSESMWHRSGHYDNYMENMFFTRRQVRDARAEDGINHNAEEDRPMAVKPMNCPGHLLIYKHRLRSHNEFPLRLAEMGLVHRREMSGVRHGLFRVQAFTQDDAHHFCTPEQINGEINLLIDFFFEVYGAFGLTDVALELSTRPEKSIGSDEMWEAAESALKGALDASGRAYKLNPGDGAFYGPKIDFHIRDCIGRTWQCGTIQLDFSMPGRFGLEYVGADGDRHTPVMIHRACYGSIERFFGIITEHFAGAFPLWLAPVQVHVLPVSEKHLEYARAVQDQLARAGLRVELDESDERLGYKIRRSALMKIPYAVVIGAKEVEHGTINARTSDGEELGELRVEQFIERLGAFTVPALIASFAAAREAAA